MKLLDTLKHREELTKVGHLLHKANLVHGTDGNISMMVSKWDLLISAKGSALGRLKCPDDFALIDCDSENRKAEGKPSSEWRMHYEIYKADSTATCVIHTHAPYLTAFASADKGFVGLDEGHKEVKVIWTDARNNAPGTQELAEKVAGLLKVHGICLIQNHGVVVCGQHWTEAYDLLEKAENFAKIHLMERILYLYDRIM